MRSIILMVLLSAAVAQARPPIPDALKTDASKLAMARVMVGEADWSEQDHTAIAWVLRKRWAMWSRTREGKTFPYFLSLYSSPLKSSVDSYRARQIRKLPWGPTSFTHDRRASLERYNRRWLVVQKLVEDWAAGRVKDPCPDALHWGGTMDRPRPGWKLVSCGATHNIFYTPKRMTKDRV